jgi:hypothetical protein
MGLYTEFYMTIGKYTKCAYLFESLTPGTLSGDGQEKMTKYKANMFRKMIKRGWTQMENIHLVYRIITFV